MRAVDSLAHDYIAERRVVQVLVPALDRQFARQDRRPRPDAVIEEVRQVVALAQTDRADCEVIDDDKLNFGDRGVMLAQGAVGMAEAEFLERPWSAHVPRGEARTTRLTRQRTRCIIRIACCSSLLTATKCILGRPSALQVASAWLASFFPRRR